MGATNRKSRRTKLNENMTGPGFDGMDFDTSRLYNDYLIPGTSTRSGSSAPGFEELSDGLFLPAFNGQATMEQVFFTWHILHDFKVGQTPTVHVHWTHNNAAPTGNVKWNLGYQYAHGYSRQNFSGTTTVLSTVMAAGATLSHMITPDDMVLPNNMEVDGMLICRLWRNPNDAQDTFPTDAFLIGVDMHYELGQIGTFERNAPFLSAGYNP